MRKLLFRLGEAIDGRKLAFLTEQPEIEELFDHGYKIAYKNNSENSELLAQWTNAWTVSSGEFELINAETEVPTEIQQGFEHLISVLIRGVDILFCDYNLGLDGDLPMCNQVMDKYSSTDFVLFSCDDIVSSDPKVQPYMVSYASPRYEKGTQLAQQHRIYCKTDAFAFCQAINAIITQRKKDNLSGGHIRAELNPYIKEDNVESKAAQQELDRFADLLKEQSSQSTSLAISS